MSSRNTLKPPLFIIILLILSGLAGAYEIYTNTKIPQQNTGQGILPYQSGIMGVVTIGPTCPVERIPPDPNCADRSYQATLRVRNSAGKIVIEQKINSDGTFKFSLPPGKYTIENGGVAVMPTLSPVSVEVGPNGYVEVNLSFDSGIR